VGGVVNDATAMVARNHGFGVAASPSPPRSCRASPSGCSPTSPSGDAAWSSSISVRRVASLVLAGFVASLATGLAVQLVSVIMEPMEEPPPEGGG
jgi:hypothetical protein